MASRQPAEIRPAAKRATTISTAFRSGGLDYYTPIGTNGAEDLWTTTTSCTRMVTAPDLFGDRATEVIDGYARSGQNFLLSLHFNAPHWPWEAPRRPGGGASGC